MLIVSVYPERTTEVEGERLPRKRVDRMAQFLLGTAREAWT
jgi:hypothetical protein